MHELALAQRLLALTLESAESAQAKRVVSVTLSLGALSHVEPAALRFAFSVASRGTIADGAAVHLERLPTAATCVSCHRVSWVLAPGQTCETCGTFTLVVDGADALRLSRLEVL